MTNLAKNIFKGTATNSLLTSTDVPVFNMTEGTGQIIILGPHNGYLVPQSLYDADQPLGLNPAWFDPASPDKRHEACDWGVAELFEQVQANLEGTGCHFLSANYSRLVCDHNRASDHWLTLEMGELGGEIPRNVNISDQEKQQRINTFYTPWFDAVTHLVERAKANNHGRALILDLHSFTPTWHGAPREFDIGTMLLEPTPISERIDAFYQAACADHNLTYKPDHPYSLQKPGIRETFAAQTLFNEHRAIYHAVEHRNDHLQSPGGNTVMATNIVNLVQEIIPSLDRSLQQTVNNKTPDHNPASNL